MEYFKSISSNNGKVNASSILLIAVVIVLAGLTMNQFFSFPDSEEERQYNTLKQLAQAHGVTVEEYVQQENERRQFYADRESINETIIDAIHLKKMDELPAALDAVKEFRGEDYSNWPYLYSEAVKAKNMNAFKWLLKQKVPCDYATHGLGRMGFYSAVETKQIEFFEMLLKSGCDIQHQERQDPLHMMIKRMNNQQWIDMLYSYYPEISLPS